MFFIMSKYPGYQIMAVSASIVTILYIILTYFVKKNNNLAIRAVIYYLVLDYSCLPFIIKVIYSLDVVEYVIKQIFSYKSSQKLQLY